MGPNHLVLLSKRSQRKADGDRQLAASPVSRVAASVPLTLFFSHAAELISTQPEICHVDGSFRQIRI